MMGVESGITGSTGTAGVMAPATPATGTETQTSEVSSAPAAQGDESSQGAIDTKETKTSKAIKHLIARKAGDTPEAVADAPTAYQPSHKFRHKDKDLDFEDWAKAAAKDAETENKIRELYQKAHGLDDAKVDRQTLKAELAETKEKIANTDRAIETISNYAREKDWDSFFEALSIPKDEILRYAVNLVQREQMPPDQKAQWESARQAQQAAKHYQLQNQQLQQSQQQFQVQQREFQLQQEVSKPEVSSIAEAYNAGMGNPGAFREFVIRIGQAYAAQGRDIPPAEAVQEAVKHLRAVNPQTGVQNVQGGEPPLKVVQPSSKPVIPNIQGRGTSPVKSTIKTLDDLKARARELDTRV